MAETKLAHNHKDLEQMNKDLKLKYPELYIKDFKIETEVGQKRKYVLVSDGEQEKWIMYSNLMKRGCKFSKPLNRWDMSKMRKYLDEIGYEDVELLDTYVKNPREPRYVLLSKGNKIIERQWNHIYRNKIINFYPKIVYVDEKIQELIDTYLYDCEILNIEDRKTTVSKKSSTFVTFIYKKRENTISLRHAIKREFEGNLNEDYLKDKYKIIDWKRFEILRIYSEKKSGKYRTLVDIKDHNFNDILSGLDTSNLPLVTLSGESISVGELSIKQWLFENSINFQQEKTFDGMVHEQPLRLDFYLPDFKIGIEYDGTFHYHSYEWSGGDEALRLNKLRDSIKNKFCEDNNIKLIRIPYWEYKNIANILTQEIV